LSALGEFHSRPPLVTRKKKLKKEEEKRSREEGSGSFFFLFAQNTAAGVPAFFLRLVFFPSIVASPAELPSSRVRPSIA
jgi:hypothetical protein